MIDKPTTLTEIRAIIGDFLQTSPDAGSLWDLICCLRGPDSPSEKPNMTTEQSRVAYKGRRGRKAKTVEVIRHHAFGGVIGGAARSRGDRNWVELPPRDQWDHFDRHVERAAEVLGLEIRVEEEKEVAGLRVALSDTPAPQPPQKQPPLIPDQSVGGMWGAATPPPNLVWKQQIVQGLYYGANPTNIKSK